MHVSNREELTVVYDSESGEIAHVHLFVSGEGAAFDEAERDKVALDTAAHRHALRQPKASQRPMATLHVHASALERGKAYRVEVKTKTIVSR